MAEELSTDAEEIRKKLGIVSVPTGCVLEEKIVKLSEQEILSIPRLALIVPNLIRDEKWLLIEVTKLARLLTFYLVRPSTETPSCWHCRSGDHKQCQGLAFSVKDRCIDVDEYGRPEICRCACRGKSMKFVLGEKT